MLALYARSMDGSRQRLYVGSETTLAEVQAQLQMRTEMLVLASWEFDRSKQRENVMKLGVTEVFSDTFGLVRRRDGPVKTCQATQGCPQVPPLMARRLRDNLLASISAFPSTSTTVTFDP